MGVPNLPQVWNLREVYFLLEGLSSESMHGLCLGPEEDFDDSIIFEGQQDRSTGGSCDLSRIMVELPGLNLHTVMSHSHSVWRTRNLREGYAPSSNLNTSNCVDLISRTNDKRDPSPLHMAVHDETSS
jgi:hypothetical protein